MLWSSTMIDWERCPGLLDYGGVITAMDARVDDISGGRAPEAVWLLEHPSIYTKGRRAESREVQRDLQFPLVPAGRGGNTTYHGPGQRIAYVMLDLAKHQRDLHRYVRDLEEWIIRSLDGLEVHGERHSGQSGVWVGDKKIAAIGVRVRRWVTSHGVSINVAPDLSHYDDIIPCGLDGHGITSLESLGVDATMADLDEELWRHFESVFGRKLVNVAGRAAGQ